MATADESIDLSSTIESNTEEVEEENDDISFEGDDSVHEGTPQKVDTLPTQTDVLELIPQAAKEKLTRGILETYQPDLTTVHERVKELVRNQGVLLDSTQNELTALKECTMLKEIGETFEQVKLYHKKLTTIKKDMSQLLERSHKAKVRANKLQFQKQKDDLAAASEKERQLIYEKELMAKPAVEYQPSKP